jgi:hypothetical protein
MEDNKDELREWKGSVESRMQQMVAKVERDTASELRPPTQFVEGIDACLATAPRQRGRSHLALRAHGPLRAYLLSRVTN